MSNTPNGTPTTLVQAIMNGLLESTKAGQLAKAYSAEPAFTQHKQLQIIESHILDFLRQKFGTAYLMAENFPAIAEVAKSQDFAMVILEDLAAQIGVTKK